MKSHIRDFRDRKVLLVGDVMLDIYTYCNVIGRTLYANALEVEKIKSSVSLGGNGLVATNVLELGGNLTFLSVVGDDEDAKYYNFFVHPKLKKVFFVDKTRKSTVKERWYAGGKALLQVNKVDNHNISKALEKKIINILEKEIKKIDVVTIMDPQHGLITKNLISHILRLSKKHKKPVYVDTQISHRSSNHHLYKGVDTILLNQREAKAVYPRFDMRKIENSLYSIKKKLEVGNVIVKLGEDGSVALMGNKYIKTKPFKVRAVDVCGAGDAFLAAFSMGDRERPEESLKIANIWGALSTRIHGTIPPRRKDLLKVVD